MGILLMVLQFKVLKIKTLKTFIIWERRTGVLITNIRENSSADGYLKEGDVILETDGIKVEGDNTVKLKGNGRIASNYLVQKHQIGDIFSVKILRDTKEVLIKVSFKRICSYCTFHCMKEEPVTI